MREEIIRTYWRNNDNPFPGRLTEVKRVRLSSQENAWLDYVRRCREARDARESAMWAQYARELEELADRAQEADGGNGN